MRADVVGALERVRPGELLGDGVEPDCDPAPHVGETFVQREPALVCWRGGSRGRPAARRARAAHRSPAVTRCMPRGRGSRTISRWVHIAPPSCQPDVDVAARPSTRRPRPRAAPPAARLRERSVGADDPVPRDRAVGARGEHRARNHAAPRVEVGVGGDVPLRHRATWSARRGAVVGRGPGRRTATGRFAGMRRGTYSIVAHDSATGELGVAVQSHWFGVAPIVPWARAGVGAVATQPSQIRTAVARAPRRRRAPADALRPSSPPDPQAPLPAGRRRGRGGPRPSTPARVHRSPGTSARGASARRRT